MILNITPEQRNKYFKSNNKGGVIYKIENSLNKDFYVGSTINLAKRYYTHLNHIRSNKEFCKKLVRAVNKYGEENFIFNIIEECNTENILIREQYYLDKLNPKYNIAKIAGSNLGIKRSEEIKLKKSISQKENWLKEDYRKKHLEQLSKNWKKGSNHKMAKITDEIAKEIKIKLIEGLNAKKISEDLGLSYYIIKDIQRNKTWKHVKI